MDGLNDRERAIVGFAERLTQHPASIGHEDIEDLRQAGLLDRDIHDVVQVAGYFAYVNRLALGLGAALEPAEHQGQWPEDA
jgi:uncharacterized peroxidase-related enzyme